MLPAAFVSTYQKYKHDTDLIASWLATAAKERGDTAPLAAPPATASSATASSATVSSATPAAPAGRLKGKARKQAKQTKQQKGNAAIPAPEENKSDAEKPKYVLTIRDFVPLAEFIAGKLAATAPPEPIPSLVSTALRRVIRVRKAFSLRLGETKKNMSSHANATHAHFVGVLEKVRDILLKPEAGGGGGDTVNADADAAGPEATEKFTASSFNMFDALRLYEPSEAFLNAPDLEHPAPAPVDLEYMAEEVEDSDTEGTFAFIALLKDLIGLRDEIGDLWRGYHSGKMDLAAAAVGTNLALELARGMEEEVAPLLKKLGGASKLIPAIFDKVCKSQGLDYLDVERVGDVMNIACYDLGSAFLFNAASLLDALLKGLPYQDGKIPSYNGKFGWYKSTTAHLEATDNRQRWLQDKAALLEAVPDMLMLFEMKGIPMQDEFARGIKAMFETQEIPVWLCFAAQNYLDTLRYFGPEVGKANDDLKFFSAIMKEQIESANALGGGFMKKELNEINDLISIHHDDMDIFTVIRMASSSNFSSFLPHNPLLCGVWMNYARAMFHRTGIAYAAKPGAVLHAVQLYTMVRQHQQQHDPEFVTTWEDLDLLLTMQGPQAFFVGGEAPLSPQAHFKNYCMSRRISPTNWLAAASRRKGKGGKVPVQMSSAGIRELKFKAPVSYWCAARSQKEAMVDPTRRVWNAAVVRQLLEASGWTDESGAGRPTLTAQQLVRHIARTIEAEIPEIIFNYAALHLLCMGLRRECSKSCNNS